MILEFYCHHHEIILPSGFFAAQLPLASAFRTVALPGHKPIQFKANSIHKNFFSDTARLQLPGEI